MAPSRIGDVIATNDSSIVSKRSAERLGYFAQEQYLRYFVTKPQRRAPLINVGYAIRSCIVDAAINRFLDQFDHQDGTVAVVNLGAGFDPSFFRILNDRQSLQDVVWIDVDYPNLIAKKRTIISEAAELMHFLPDFNDKNPCSSTRPWVSYGTIPADLCQTQSVIDKLRSIISPAVPVLFVSEVSTVYMPHSASDALLAALAAAFSHAQYVCLEQTLPEGEVNTAYSATMMHHFTHNVHTPLRGTLAYPTLEKQSQRLKAAGWKTVVTETLLEIWQRAGDEASSPLNIGKDRARILQVEPFDEWEELELFLSHYYVGTAQVEASTTDAAPQIPTPVPAPNDTPTMVASAPAAGMADTIMTMNLPFYRRGHTSTAISDVEILVFGGFGLGSLNSKTAHVRLAHPTILTFPSLSCAPQLVPLAQDSCPSARMHHTACRLSRSNTKTDVVVLYGGRDGPQSAFSDVWIFHMKNRSWEQVQPVVQPPARYRHAACPVVISARTYLFIHGGVGSDGIILDDAWLFDIDLATWHPVPKATQVLGKLHSHAIWSNRGSVFVHGGISCHQRNTLVAGRLVQLDFQSAAWSDAPQSAVEKVTSNVYADIGVHRCGHEVTLWCPETGLVLMSGGITPGSGSPKRSEQIVLVDYEKGSVTPVNVAGDISRLMVQHSLTPLRLKATLEDDATHRSAVVLGGGGTCFSFGSRFDTGALLISSCPLRNIRSIEMATPSISVSSHEDDGSRRLSIQNSNCNLPVSRVLAPSESSWDKIVRDAAPVVIRKLSIGPCQTRWTPNYLKQKCGQRSVSVHISPNDTTLRWHNKNFRYAMMPFTELIERTLEKTSESSRETVYLRSLSTSPKRPASLAVDFPEIASDFVLPAPLKKCIDERFFSSPLRMSGADMRMWAHYDASDNILVQVSGRKLVRLWHPCDVDKLYIEGSSSLIPDLEHVDLMKFPLFALATPFETILEPGDILFIPALWLHSVKCLTPCISVNVFFRSHPASMYATTDIWSNQDLLPYQAAQQAVTKAISSLDTLPHDQKQFYLKKLGMSLIAQAERS